MKKKSILIIVAFMSIFLYARNIDFENSSIYWGEKSKKEVFESIIKNNCKDYNLPILIKKVESSSPDYVGGIDVDIEFWNTGTKTIKYIYIDFLPYNRVDDVASCSVTGKSTMTGEIVDYIDPYSGYKTGWRNLWYNSSIEYCKINGIRIIYKDNSEVILTINELNLLKEMNPIKLDLLNDENVSLYFEYLSERGEVDLFFLDKTVKDNKVSNLQLYINNSSFSVKIDSSSKQKSKNYVGMSELLNEVNSMEIVYTTVKDGEKKVTTTDPELMELIENFSYVINCLPMR